MKKTPFELYFDGGNYWVPCGERFLRLDKRDAIIHMTRHGLEKVESEPRLTVEETMFYHAQTRRALDYAGPLAGHRAGYVEISGARVLVTQSFNLAESKSGSTKRIDTFLTELFGAQVPHVLAWLKHARASLHRGDFAPGQVLVLAGPSGCGKSLFQSIITEFLGGRAGKPYRYMTGATAFNADLAAAEHWIIEDEKSSTDIRARRHFGAALKDATVNKEMSIHAKGRQAVTLPTWRRASISLNDEAETLSQVPPIDASLADKLMLLKCGKASVGHDRAETWSNLTRELPALAAMLNRWKVPASMRDERFGVRAWHHPELLSVLSDMSPESRLLSLVDQAQWDYGKEGFWAGTAEEVEKVLRSSSLAFATDKLLCFSSACGVYLARLATLYPTRFSMTRNGTRRVWKISKE